MTNAQNGARIKAWAGPNVGSGIVKNITFENFFETAVQNPVIIDQVCGVGLFFGVVISSQSKLSVLYDERHSLCPVPFQHVHSRRLI